MGFGCFLSHSPMSTEETVATVAILVTRRTPEALETCSSYKIHAPYPWSFSPPCFHTFLFLYLLLGGEVVRVEMKIIVSQIQDLWSTSLLKEKKSIYGTCAEAQALLCDLSVDIQQPADYKECSR